MTAKTDGDKYILIAEDSPTQAAQLTHLLERCGYRVAAARHGREALEMLERELPSLVITDVVMPEMDGYDLCKAIKSDPRFCEIPVMLVTTLADAEDVIRGLECGADNFIRKPYDERYLMTRVEYLLANLSFRKNQKMQVGIEICLGKQKHFITSDRQQILDLLISTYEQAVQMNADLKDRERELRKSNGLLQGLYRVAEGLNQATTEREVTAVALERVLELPGIEGGWLFLADEGGSKRIGASLNLPPVLQRRGALEGDCLCWRRLTEKSLDGVNLVRCERLEKLGVAQERCSHATVPLSLGDRSIGVMNLLATDREMFGEEELRVLSTVGNQVSIALERTHLKSQLETLVADRTAGLEREIMERKRAEEELRLSEERYRLLFNRNPHPSWVYDTATLAFVAVNEAAIRHYGYSRAEFLSMTLKDIRPAEDVPELLRELEEHPEVPESTTAGIFRHKTKDGRIIEVEISSSEITFAGRPAGLVLAMDVTERRRLEQQFLRAQRMESIGTLAGGIAHDLNNLLMPIMMGVSLLRRFHTDEPSIRSLDNIERSARRGRDLVKQVLSFARGVEGSRVPVHVADICREIHAIVNSTFPKNLTYDIDIPPDIWWVDGDPTQLHQLFLNLSVNARDAMPGGGTITVAAKNIEIDEQYARMRHDIAAGKYVMVEMTDEGSGIPAGMIDRIFEPFFTTKSLTGGTGLGLSTVAAIVRSHGGVVTVYSEVGRGTTFKVYLPARKPEDGTTPIADLRTVALPRGKGELILVVDDEATILSITQQTLESFGYRALTAEDGAQAVALFAMRRDEIAAVITDMTMPIMDGPALVSAIRRIDPDVRIIASSGLNDEGRLSRVAHAGVTHFLEKPYSADVLLSTLATVLASS